MVSAFHAPIARAYSAEKRPRTISTGSPTSSSHSPEEVPMKTEESSLVGRRCAESDMGETEDEEVKVNCIGGIQPYMTTSDEDDSDEDDDDVSCCSDDSEDDEEEKGVVHFVARRIIQAPEICRPQAMLGGIREECDSDASETSSTTSEAPIGMADVDVEDYSCSMSQDESEADDERSDNDDSDSDDDDEEENDDEELSDDEEELASSDDFDKEVEEVEGYIDDDDSDNISAAGGSTTLSVADEDLSQESSTSDMDTSSRTPESCDEASQTSENDIQSTEIIDRVLSLDSMTLPNTETSHLTSKRSFSSIFPEELISIDDAPKRMRCRLSTMSPVSTWCLDPSSERYESREATVSPFSEREIEHDKQLSEELAEAERSDDRESTPVPLLSPPPSPLCVESERGQITTVCEWPCNLVIDSALTLITGLRAHSPASLVRLEEEEEDRVFAYQGLDSATTMLHLQPGIRVNLD